MKFASFQLISFDGKVVTFTHKANNQVYVNAEGFSLMLGSDPEELWELVYNKVAPVVYGSVSRGKKGVHVNATNSMVKDLVDEIEKLFW
jgi:hypothetical protein